MLDEGGRGLGAAASGQAALGAPPSRVHAFSGGAKLCGGGGVEGGRGCALACAHASPLNVEEEKEFT
jgi:hypothetical protein